jgi:putative copper resistance protein D
MNRWPSLLTIPLLLLVWFASTSNVHAQASSGYQDAPTETGIANDSHQGHASGRWEGSPEGRAFSEFNHHFAGLCDVVFGLAELGYALQYPLPLWTRLVLPGALGVVGGFVLIWSDHDAWPIGSLSFRETFFGQDREVVEHKFYGVMALLIALCETLRRLGRVRHPVWAAPLVLSTLAGALWLFVHSHGNHPAAAKIQFHHSLLALVGVGAGLSKGMASWLPGALPHTRKRWEVAWAGSVILFGFLLLVYSQ